MKRELSLFIMLAVSTICLAGGIKVKNGQASFKNETANAIAEFDFSNTTWEGKENFKVWCKDQYENRITAIERAFVNSFNDNSKSLKISKDNSDIKYKIVIKVIDLERHQAFTGSWGQGKFSTTALIIVKEISSDMTICEIEVNGYGSGKDYDYADGLAKCYKGLAKEVCKLK